MPSEKVGIDKLKVKSLDISGFRRKAGSITAYEMCCQKMLFDGIDWLKGKQPDIFNGTKTYNNIYGVLDAPKALEPLEKLWNDRYQPSGAQHQAVMQHLMRITKYGFDAWLSSCGKDRIIEIDLDITNEQLHAMHKEDMAELFPNQKERN